MASLSSSFQSQSIPFPNITHFQTPPPYHQHSLSILGSRSNFLPKWGFLHFQYSRQAMPMRAKTAVVSAAAPSPAENKKKPINGFVDELRSTALRSHSKEQAREGQKEVKEPHERHVAKWDPTFDGCLKFLVDSKLVYDTLERIIQNPAFPYVELRNTGLERSERLAKDLEWIKDQGHVLPEPSDLGVNYANYLKELSIVKDSHLILCHFYNLYFGHTAGGRIMAKKLSEKIMNNKELEFYKWDGEVSQLLQNVTDKLNKLTESWTREEKNQCLGETEISFKYYGDIISLILS